MWGQGSKWNQDDPDFSDAYGSMGSDNDPYSSTGGLGGMGSTPAPDASNGSGIPVAGLMSKFGGGSKSAGTGPDGIAEPPSAMRTMGTDAAAGASMGGPWGAVIGAGVGLLKNSSDQAHYKQQVLQAANTDRLSYITGRKGQMPAYQNPWNNPVALASQGAAYGQSRDAASSQAALQQAYLARMNAGTAAITKGQFAPPSGMGSSQDPSVGMAGPQKPASRVSDSIWMDNPSTSDSTDQNNMNPLYDRYRMGV